MFQVCRKLEYTLSIQKTEKKTLITQDCTKCKKFHSEKKIIRAVYYCFVGDVNFASDLSDMRHRQKFHVIVLHPEQSAAGALLACAHEAYSFAALVADVSPRIAKKKPLVSALNSILMQESSCHSIVKL